MITLKELKTKTGYDSFLKFKRNCIRSSASLGTSGFTQYFYDSGKVVELDIKPEEVFMAADEEINKRSNRKPVGNKNSELQLTIAKK